MQPIRNRPLRRLATIAGVTLSASLAAALLGVTAASAAPTYSTAATLSTAGPSVFSTPPTDQPIANLTITELVANGVDAPASPNNYVCVALSGGATFVNGSGSPSQVPVVTSSQGNVGAATVTGGEIAFPVTAASSAPATYTLSNLYVTATGGTLGPITASVTESQTSTCSNTSLTTPPDVALTSTASAFGVETSTQTTYGATPDATTATEFSSVVNCSDSAPTHNTAVVATDLDPYDALSAATLEGALSATGNPTALLITPQGSAGPDLMNALKADGVGTVYVVGGPLAISSSVISTLQSTPATTCSGGTAIATSSSIKVVGPIYGATADDTAMDIDNQANSIDALTNTLPAPAATYNDTTGNTTGTWTTGGRTAIVVSDTDYADAMAVAGAAFQRRIPVILTPATSLGSQATTELSALSITNVLVLGGQLAVANNVVTTLGASGYAVLRIAGQDQTDTAQLLARYEESPSGLDWSASSHTALLAQGAYWSDALGSAAISSANNAPLFLTEGPTSGLGTYLPTGLTAEATTIFNLQVLGGPLAVPQSQITAALMALAS
jgi:putative cell wall-binding protein